MAASISLLFVLAAVVAANAHLTKENHSLLGLRRVSITTDPPDARMVFVPYSADTGALVPREKVRASGRSPVEVELRPGDYFVVAARDDGSFMETVRHVPRLAGDPPGPFFHDRWITREDGAVELDKIKIPPKSVTQEMVLVGDPKLSNPGSVPPYYMDTHEFTERDWENVHDLPSIPPFVDLRIMRRGSNYPMMDNFDNALHSAELAGKRLPTLEEYEAAMALVPADRRPKVLSSDIKPVDEVIGDATETAPPIVGLLSNVAEWTTNRTIPIPKAHAAETGILAFPDDYRTIIGGSWRLILGSDPTENFDTSVGLPRVRRNAIYPWLGFRCVRSAKAPFFDDDQ